MAYPTLARFQEVLQNPSLPFSDPELKNGTLRKSGFGLPAVVSGGFALTYAVESGGKTHAVRCFHRQAPELERRYQAIHRRLWDPTVHRDLSPYLLTFAFQPKGIRVDGRDYPIVKMDWGTGETLGRFLAKNHQDRDKVSALVASFRQLARLLEAHGVAHGDIQEGNVLVSDSGRRLQLIDYDGMYVPELAALGPSEIGHRDYQHPRRGGTVFDGTLDRFSFIALDLALRALCEDRFLWTTSQSGADVIVFSANDFAAPRSSTTLAAIRRISNLKASVERFIAVCEGPFESVPSLSDFVAARNIPPIISSVHETNASRVGATSPQPYISQYPVLSAKDYSAFVGRIGQTVELVGEIVGTYKGTTSEGRPYVFLFFERGSRQSVKINLWEDALNKGGDAPTAAWIGRWVSLKGLVQPVHKKQRGYENIAISAETVWHITTITADQAQYRLKAVPSAHSSMPKVQARPSNADVLHRMKTGSTRPSRPVPSNQQILARQTRPSAAPVAPLPPPTHSAQSLKRGGLLRWLLALFR